MNCSTSIGTNEVTGEGWDCASFSSLSPRITFILHITTCAL